MSEQAKKATPPLFDAERYVLDNSVGYWLTRARSALAATADQELAPLDITHGQAAVLVKLASGRCVTNSALGREFGTDVGSMTRLVDRLEKRGLVQRVRSDADRRVVMLRLTDQGRALAAEVPAYFVRALNQRFRDFSPEEVDMLKRLLQRVVEAGQTDGT